MNDLAERKQLLLAQSEAHRLLIQLECQHLQSSLRWLEPVEKVAQAARSHRWMLGAAAGLMMAWRGRSLLKWPLRGLAVWRLVRRFI